MTEHVEQEILDPMPVRQEQAGALVAQDNPYMAMAVKAMELGKVDQLDKLLDLQMKWDAEQQRKAFVAAMSSFKEEAGGVTIAKSKNVSFSGTNYNHAELHDITRALVPIMAKHGLSHRWVTAQGDDKSISVECVISHREGHSERVSMTAPPDDSGKKNTIQQIASTVTYLSRYTLLAATGVATGGELDDDARSRNAADAEPVEYITEEQQTALRDLIEAYVNNVPKLYDWIASQVGYRIDSLADIPANRFEIVHMQLGSIRKQKIESEAESND